MKKLIILSLLLVAFCGWSQNTDHYKKVFAYGQYRPDWALVKTVANTYGFIDRNGKEVVSAVYAKIYNFETKQNGQKFAMVKNVAGAYGFIDQNGKEVIQAIYFKKEQAVQKLNAMHHGI